MNQSASALGDAVRIARKSRNLSQEALAERVGVCKRTIMDIEKNIGNPKFEVLSVLVRELDLPLYQIFYPETENDADIRNLIFNELNKCPKDEMKVVLSVVKSLCDALNDERKTV